MRVGEPTGMLHVLGLGQTGPLLGRDLTRRHVDTPLPISNRARRVAVDRFRSDWPACSPVFADVRLAWLRAREGTRLVSHAQAD